MDRIENSKSMDSLLQQLERIGFSGLKPQILSHLKSDTPYFTINHIKKYGEEKMIFELTFHNDLQENKVTLDWCGSRHVSPISIENTMINGINTGGLDERMSEINWEKYFARDTSLQNIRDIQIARSSLFKLSFNNHKKGKELMERLIYKHFPKEQWNESIKKHLSPAYESIGWVTREFKNWNANLCYLEMSGRFQKIMDYLSSLKVNDLNFDCFHHLSQKILEGKERFDLEFRYNLSEGLFEIKIPIDTRQPDILDHFTLNHIMYPKLDHDTYNYINSGELENEMQKINWKDDRCLFNFDEYEMPKIKPEIALITDQLFQLSHDLIGQEIAELLSLKYFIGTTFFEDTIQETAWERLEDMRKRSLKYNPYFTVKQAINLSIGKAVWLPNFPNSQPGWGQNFFDENNNYLQSQIISGLAPSELERQLKMIVPQDSIPNIVAQLQSGENVKVKSLTNKEILIRAFPLNKTIRIYDKNMQLIPFNFMLETAREEIKSSKDNPERNKNFSRNEFTPRKKRPKNKGHRL